MRKWLIPFAVASIVAVPLAVAALTLHNGTPLDHQRAKVQGSSISTHSTDWVKARGLTGTLVCAKGQVSAMLSVTITGAPAEFRMRIDDGGVMEPELAHFDPSAGTRSFSYTYIAKVGTFEASDGHSFDVEWRSPTGGVTTLRRGDVNLLFRLGSC